MRRNKPRVVWLPPTNTFSADPSARSVWQFASANITTPIIGQVDAIEVPIIQDGITSSPLNPTSSLADIEDSGYRLRRVVGKLYVFIGQTETGGVRPGQLFGVTAGLIIRRIDGTTGGSLAVAGGGIIQVDPADIENSMDPWIWRRSWLLANNGTTNPTLINDVPAQNFGAEYPGSLEGPHIDQKTARVVGPEERLFLDVSSTCILASDNTTTSLVIIYEMRVLGSMRTSVGNRRNASR